MSGTDNSIAEGVSQPHSESLTDRTGDPVHPLEVRWAGDPDQFPGFIIDGVLTDKLSLLAAYPGKGKTTALAMLACVVAGKIKTDGLEVQDPRNVVFISEHPEQVALMLGSIAQHYNLDLPALLESVVLVDAARMPVESFVQANWSDHAVSHTINGITQTLLPWVVMDTYAATIQMENENDNAEGSAIMASIKQKVVARGYPVTLCAHTSKVHKHGDAADMTARGASAFEGDTMQVIYLSADDLDNRFLEISVPKHRFTADVHSIQITPHLSERTLFDKYKQERRTKVLWAELQPLDGEGRDAIKEQIKAQRLEQIEAGKLSTQKRIEDQIIKVVKENPGIKKRGLEARVAGNNEQKRWVLAALLSEGALKLESRGRAHHYYHVNEEGAETDDPPF